MIRAHRLLGVALGALAVIIGVFLLRRAKFAIALSAIGAAIVAIAAAFAAPVMRGPVILRLRSAGAVVRAVCGIRGARAVRTLVLSVRPASRMPGA